MNIAHSVSTLALGLSFFILFGCGGSDREDAVVPLTTSQVTVSYGIKQVSFFMAARNRCHSLQAVRAT